MARLTKAETTRQERSAQERQVIDLLVQGKTAAEIESALGLAAGTVTAMRRNRDFRHALSEARALRDLARMDRLQALAGHALDGLEAALTQDDVDPKLWLAVLQLVAKLPPATWRGEGAGSLEEYEEQATRPRF